MTPFSTEVRTLFRLLEDADGNRRWHDFREIKERLATTVAPGKALRRYEERLSKRRERGGHAPMVNDVSEDEKVLYGQRLIADNVIQAIKRRWLDVEHNGGGYGHKMIRLKPEVKIPASNPTTNLPGGAEEPWDDGDGEAGTEEPDDSLEPAEDALEPAEDALGEPPPVYATGPPPMTRRQRHAARQPFVCRECGVMVPDPAQHEEFHAQFVRRDALAEAGPPEPTPPASHDVALFSESQVRRIIAEEVGLQLDAFQSGFQNWLVEFMSDPEHTCLLRTLHGREVPVPGS